MAKIVPPKSSFDPNKIIMEQEEHVANQKVIREDLHKYVTRGKWPVTDELISPSMPEGADFPINMVIPLKKYLWDAIDRHVKALGVSKAQWTRHAIMKLMYEEQEYFLKNRKDR